MKKIIAFVAFMSAFGLFASHPPVSAPHHAATATLSPSAMTQASRWLPTEAYDAI